MLRAGTLPVSIVPNALLALEMLDLLERGRDKMVVDDNVENHGDE